MLQHEQFLSSITGSLQQQQHQQQHHQHHHHHQSHSQTHSHHSEHGPAEHERDQEHQHQQRPLQQSSPSDQSVSTGTPPHQVSRASPASTALVMSSNNIASRQLTPNGSSGDDAGSPLSQQRAAAASGPADSADGSGGGGGGGEPPSPVVRQFACHSKSMSAGVVVPVPGISNNLASITGMQQNNMINSTIAAVAAAAQMGHHPHHHQQAQQHQHQQQQQLHHQQEQHQIHHQQQQLLQHGNQMQHHHHHHHTLHHPSNSGASQQLHQLSGTATSVSNKKSHQRRSHHHRSVSQQQPHQLLQQQVQQTHQHAHPQQQQHHHHHQAVGQHQFQQQQQLHALNFQQPPHHQSHHAHPHPHQAIAGSSQNFLDAGVGGSSSIILSNANINNIHNRSASTHLSSLMLSGNHNHSNHNHNNNNNNNNHHFPQPSQRSHIGAEHQIKTDSIWSIDENLSKSQGKLTASGYLHPAHSYLLNPSITTDISCDNISTASRLMGVGPAQAPGGAGPGAIGSHHLVPASSGPSGPTSQVGPPDGPAPGYYAAHHAQRANNSRFLPICDLMFNLISMVLYFCESVFGVIALIALYYHAGTRFWALAGAALVCAANFVCQYLSLRWLFKMKLEECRRKREAQEELENEEECERRRHYYNRMSAHVRSYQCGSCAWLPDGATEVQLKFLLSIALDAIAHVLCLGLLMRYIKLVIPVSDTSRVKREARDLCMLRLIHGFLQSGPLLLLQCYMVCSQNYPSAIANLSVVSIILSLISICWALASFTKYARKKYMHKFVLTWLGILSQLLWRLGTISSRVAALTIYAVYYNYWMLVVLALHWVTMFLWLVKPGNLLRDETQMSRPKKLALAVGASWIYCFCYMNFEEHNSRTKMGIFYLIMFVENNLLFTVCQAFSAQVTWFKSLVILVVYLGFVFGMLFMLLYYKYFHVSVLNGDLTCSQDSIDSIADQLSPAGKKIAGFKPGTLRLKSDDGGGGAGAAANRGPAAKYNSGNMNGAPAGPHPHHNNNNTTTTTTLIKTGSHPEIGRAGAKQPAYLAASGPQSGVFSCKLNAASFKKPSLTAGARD